MKFIFSIFVLALSSMCFSAQTGSGKINMMQNGYGGWLFSIDHAANNPESCTNAVMKLDPAHAQYEEIYSYLLTAYATGNPIIAITNGCDTDGYNTVHMVYSTWGS